MAPWLVSRATTWLPKKPLPPVTTTLRPRQNVGLLAGAVTMLPAYSPACRPSTDRIETMSRVRVALTFEQCWRESPGGTGVAAVELGLLNFDQRAGATHIGSFSCHARE